MTEPRFQPGDRVRRKPEWQDKNGWKHGSRVLTVKETEGLNVSFNEFRHGWSLRNFEFAEPRPQPYAIQAKDFDPKKQERSYISGTGMMHPGAWTTDDLPTYVNAEYWLVVRDKPEPPKLALEIRIRKILLDTSITRAYEQARAIAKALRSEDYATEYPNTAGVSE